MPQDDPQQIVDKLYSNGWLLADHNDDGFPDDIPALVVCDGEDLDVETWRSVIDLAARLGLESSGFTPPLVSQTPLPGRTTVRLRPGDASNEPVQIDPKGDDGPVVTLFGTAGIDALALGGEVTPLVMKPGVDLGDLLTGSAFSVAGLLGDSPGGDAVDLGRVQIVLGDEVSFNLGVALACFAARLGLESGGVTFPVATTGPVRAGAIPLRVDPKEGNAPRLTASDDGSLMLSGEPDGIAGLLNRLATMDSGALQPAPARALQWLRRSLAGWTVEGRMALLGAALDEHGQVEAPASVRVLATDTDEQGRLASVVRDALDSGVDVLAPGNHAIAFQHEWTAEWEVDRALDTIRWRVLPRLNRAAPADITVIVSEPPGVRRRLERQIREMLGSERQAVGSVHALDAFKAGLSWLTDVVLPELRELDGLQSIALRFKPVQSSEPDTRLDLSIRWLQELFPGDEILAGALGIDRDRVELAEHDGPETYVVEALDAAGNSLLRRTFSPLSRTIDYLAGYPSAGSVIVTTGGVIARQGDLDVRQAFQTDPERFWSFYQSEVLPKVRRLILESSDGNPQVADQPLFDEIYVDVTMSESDEPYGIREERHSAAEALHEDIYFNTLDYIEEIGSQTSGERLIGPGAVIPIVHVVPGRRPQARVRLTRRARSIALLEDGHGVEPLGRVADELPPRPEIVAFERQDRKLIVEIGDLDNGESHEAALRALARLTSGAESDITLRVPAGDGHIEIAWPGDERAGDIDEADPVPVGEILSVGNLPGQLKRLEQLPEVSIEWTAERSFQGRAIPTVAVTAPRTSSVWSTRKLGMLKPTLLVAARHHANEVASTTAALQLIERLATDPEWRPLLSAVNVALIPIENPDGAALHDRLRAEHPTWKHHPARYNAVGFEFGLDQGNPDSRYGESRIRDLLWYAWLPDIVVDNHGVPSHEWAQLFAGFGSPPRFGVSYWQLQALLYGIISYLDSDEHPAHREAMEALRDAVGQAVARDDDLYAWNQIYADRYETWGHRWEPERFPMPRFHGMIFHNFPVNPESTWSRRSFAVRHPRTTVVNWVTEVGDETVSGAELERTARAHLTANRAAIDLLAAASGRPPRRVMRGDGSTWIGVARERPIRLK